MRLICPNCGTQYEVAVAAIPKLGRDVQCGACQTTWFVTPEEDPAPLQEPAPAEEPQDEAPPPPPPATSEEDTFAEIQRRIAEEAEALEEGRDTEPELDDADDPEGETDPSAPVAVTKGTPDVDPPEEPAPARVEEPMPEAAAPPTPGPQIPSRDEVAAAMAEVARPDAPRPSAAVTNAAADLGAEIEALKTEAQDRETKPADVVFDAVSRTSAGAAAAAGLAAAKASEEENASLSERLKRRVAEAATEREQETETDSGLLGASADAVAVASAQKVDKLPDADSLASSLRVAAADETEGALEAEAQTGRFWRGFGAAMGVAACALLVYVTAPTLSRIAPSLEPALSGFTTSVDSTRTRIVALFGRS